MSIFKRKQEKEEVKETTVSVTEQPEIQEQPEEE